MGKQAIKMTLGLYFAFMALLVTVALVEAAEVGQTHKLSWVMPTTRTDGTALKATEITGVDIRYGDKPVAVKYKAIGTAKAPALVYEVDTTGPGTHCYQVRTVVGTLKSEWSGQQCAEVLALPSPPKLSIELVLRLTSTHH